MANTDPIIVALQKWLTDYNNLETGAPVLIDFLGAVPTGYSINPMPGKTVTWDLDYVHSERTYPFAIQFMGYTVDDATRIENSGFCEALGDWFDAQTRAGTLPTMADKQSAVAIYADTFGFLYSEGQSGTGIYQILCHLEYDQDDS